MATLLFFHAHPDDESIATGATMAKAASLGHRVLLAVATGGELGERPRGVSTPEELAAVRAAETSAAARELGVSQLSFLGYRDSGMAGTADNRHPDAFARAEVGDAADRLCRLIRADEVDALVIYEPNGGSGHPDHVHVHTVGAAAAARSDIPTYESAMNRDHFLRLASAARDAGLAVPDGPADLNAFGVPGEQVTLTIDGRQFADAKRRAMQAHRSQIAETSVFLAIPDAFFPITWGYEWYIHHNDAARHDDVLRLLEEPVAPVP